MNNPIIKSIDDLLHAKPTEIETESKDADVEEIEAQGESHDYDASEETETQHDETEESEEEEASEDSPKFDEYGNEIDEEPATELYQAQPAQQERYYTEQELNERINQAVRKRLKESRSQDDDYSNDEGVANFQEQLKNMVASTITDLQRQQALQYQQEVELKRQAEFEAKFMNGTKRFKDYKAVIQNKPINDYMFNATRHMNDPSGFIYTACKRAPEEIERIAKLNDPYTQIAEIAKLEEKLKAKKQTTKAPKPVKTTKGDATTKEKAARPRDILAAADSERWQRIQSMRRR